MGFTTRSNDASGDVFNFNTGTFAMADVPNAPQDGWITGCTMAVENLTGSFGTGDAVMSVHDGDGTRLGMTNEFSFFDSPGKVTYFRNLSARVSDGTALYVGFWADRAMEFRSNSGSTSANSGTNTRVHNSVSGPPLDAIPDDVHYTRKLFASYLFASQEKPGDPAWRSPTPANNAIITTPTPTISATLTHPDDSPDSTDEYQLRIKDADTNETLLDETYNATGTENSQEFFSRSPITLLPGQRVNVDVRHRDTWDVWSDWSAVRTFELLDNIPTDGVFQSPTPTEDSVINDSTPTIKGTTPHGDDAGYDYTSVVQIKYWDGDTGAILDDLQITPSADMRAGDYFEYTLPAVSAGTKVMVQFRHADRNGNWSPNWSAVREFNIAPGPDRPTLSRPVGKIDYRNQTERNALGLSGDMYSGSYNNPSGAVMNSVRVQIRNRARTTIVADSGWVAKTATAGVWTLAQSAFPASGTDVVAHPTALQWATEYSVRAAVAEEAPGGGFGIQSDWSEYFDFNTNAFPDKPTGLSPAGGIATELLNFTAVTADPDGDLVTHAAMKIIEVASNVAVKVATRPGNTNVVQGAEYKLNNAAVPWRYQAQNAGRTVRATDTNFLQANLTSINLEGETLRENPTAAILSSTAYTVGQQRVRRATTPGTQTLYYEVTAITTGTSAASEPAGFATATDGQTIVDSGVTWTVRTAVLWRNMGPETEHSMSVAGTSLSKTFTASLLTLGTEYRWQARARDAVGWGDFSDLEVFTYAAVPTVDALAPRVASRVNKIADPGAEYDLSIHTLGEWWVTAGADAQNTIERYDQDASSGNYSWRAITSAASALIRTTPFITVDASKPWPAQVALKKLSGTSASRFRVACYNASDALISRVVPASIASANLTNVPTSWTRYGGIIWPIGSGNSPAFPAGTAKVKLEIEPSVASVADVLIDDVAFEDVNFVFSSGTWLEAQNWFGYFDGDTQGYDTETERFFWLGDAGRSESQGIPRLTETQPNLYFQYTHSLNMQSRRLRIDRWEDGKQDWKQIYDSGFIADTQTTGAVVAFPLPAAIVLNEEMYRFRLSARDTAGISGEATPAIADIFYIGPVELPITETTPNQIAAEMLVGWQQTAVPSLEFARYEIARVGSDGKLVILDRITNPATTSYVDIKPLSDEAYTYLVRQVSWVGTDLVQGRWSRAHASVNYGPYHVIKDLSEPRALFVAFDTPLENVPAAETDAIRTLVTPWGATSPTILKRKGMKLRTIPVRADFYAEALNQEDHIDRFDKMIRMLENDSTYVLLTQSPRKQVIYCGLNGPWRPHMVSHQSPGVEFSLQEVNYAEDVRDREGT
jgi:hypothetical protein